jgi:hypothetical protein
MLLSNISLRYILSKWSSDVNIALFIVYLVLFTSTYVRYLHYKIVRDFPILWFAKSLLICKASKFFKSSNNFYLTLSDSCQFSWFDWFQISNWLKRGFNQLGIPDLRIPSGNSRSQDSVASIIHLLVSVWFVAAYNLLYSPLGHHCSPTPHSWEWLLLHMLVWILSGCGIGA